MSAVSRERAPLVSLRRLAGAAAPLTSRPAADAGREPSVTPPAAPGTGAALAAAEALAAGSPLGQLHLGQLQPGLVPPAQVPSGVARLEPALGGSAPAGPALAGAPPAPLAAARTALVSAALGPATSPDRLVTGHPAGRYAPADTTARGTVPGAGAGPGPGHLALVSPAAGHANPAPATGLPVPSAPAAAPAGAGAAGPDRNRAAVPAGVPVVTSAGAPGGASAGPQATALAGAQAGPSAATADTADLASDPAALDRLAQRLYGRLRGHFAAELLGDRERAQLLTDL
jgi:hypothetical protein